jgi:general secretion pathway protein K
MKRERGLAAVTAILIVAVAASAATLMLAQQSAMLDQAMMVASRAQADLYAQAGIDWARGVLAEDARRSSAYDSLDEGWAQPIAALPVERAVVSGAIGDEQAKFNLNNLVDNGRRSEADVKIFKALLAGVGLPPELSDAVVDWIDADDDLTAGAGAENAYYLSLPRPYRTANRPMEQVEELYRVRGFDAAAVAKLKPYVSALRSRTAINANTASGVVLAAALGLQADRLASLVAERRSKPFRTRAAFESRIRKEGVNAVGNEIDVKSAFFSVAIQVAQDDVRLAIDALVRRGDNASTDIIWRRPRY